MSRLGLIDAREFARLGQWLEGRLPVAGFVRLAPQLCRTGGELRYRLQGSMDERGNGALQLECAAEVAVICQRCLQPLELPLRIRNKFRLLDAEPAWHAEAAEIDADADDELDASSPLDVEALIEDEVLLSLPWVPRHELCELSGVQGGNDEDGRESPFGVLARLKRRR